MASTGETLPGPRDMAAGGAPADGTPVQALTSPQAAAFIGERGGSLYVWVTTARSCCGAPIGTVRSSPSAPPGVTGYRRFDAGGFPLLLHPSTGDPPSQMAGRLRGRARPPTTVHSDEHPI